LPTWSESAVGSQGVEVRAVGQETAPVEFVENAHEGVGLKKLRYRLAVSH
jgi:hypothetical protein